MAWIDYRKAYDVVPHLQILKCLEMVGVAGRMVTNVWNSTANWETVLMSGGNDSGRSKYRA